MSDQILQYRPRKYLSISTLLSFARCPRRYFYQKMGLVPKGDEPGAPLYGTAMHKATTTGLTRGIEAAMLDFFSIWKVDLNDEKRNPERAAAQLRHYIHQNSGTRTIFKLEPAIDGGLARGEDTNEFEIPWVLDVGLDIPIVGRIDGLVRHRDTGRLWGREFKTSSRISSGFFDGFNMHPQILTYALVLATLTQEPIDGFMIDAMLIDKVKVDSMTGLVQIPPFRHADTLKWLRTVGQQLLDCEKSMDFFQDFSGCTPYVHYYMSGFPCEYKDLCSVENWEALTPLYDVKDEFVFTEIKVDGDSIKTTGDVIPTPKLPAKG